MLAFEISIDGRKMCTMALTDLDVATVTTTWVRRPAPDPVSGDPSTASPESELKLDVGGLQRDADGASVHLRWLHQALAPGQRITLAIVETDDGDPPRSREREDPASADRRKRQYYERLKREYGEANAP
jgi:hypothetical protein